VSRREKIIVVITVLAALYGAYNFLFSSSGMKSRTAGVSRQELNSFITETFAGISRALLTPDDREILMQAATQWETDPFVRSTAPLTRKRKSEPRRTPVETAGITYSGYIKMGNRYLAIINGMEYEVGDRLEPEGHVVSLISPEKIVIRLRGKSELISLPLKEAAPST